MGLHKEQINFYKVFNVTLTENLHALLIFSIKLIYNMGTNNSLQQRYGEQI